MYVHEKLSTCQCLDWFCIEQIFVCLRKNDAQRYIQSRICCCCFFFLKQKRKRRKSLHSTSKKKKTNTTPSKLRIQYVRTNEKENNVWHIQNNLFFFVGSICLAKLNHRFDLTTLDFKENKTKRKKKTNKVTQYVFFFFLVYLYMYM
jgi:hypothetical protein